MTWTPIPIGERAFDRGAYHNARGHQQRRRATQTGHSRAEAHEALTAAERTQRNQGRRETLVVLDQAHQQRQGGLDPVFRYHPMAHPGDLALKAIIDRAASWPSLPLTSATATPTWPTETYVILLRARLSFFKLRRPTP